jgi:hypothetical protein
MFDGDLNDGFFSQIIYVSENYNNTSVVSPLFIIHILRLLIVSPFFLIYLFELPPYFDAFIFTLYLIPLFLYRGIKFKLIFILVIFFLPFMFSYRTVLGMLGMLYLYLCLFYCSGKYLLLTISALLANLSSGMVLGWIFAIFTSIKFIRNKYPKIIPLLILMILGFLGSVIHKYEFMFTALGTAENGNMLERSTYYVAVVNEQYSRLFLYLVLAITLISILISPLFSKGFSHRKFLFFIGAVPLLFFEGVGLVSYSLCMVLIIFNNIYYFFRKEIGKKKVLLS